MSRPACCALIAALSSAACQQPEPPVFDVETTRVYAEDKRSVFDDIVAFLESRDVEVVDADVGSGTIRAERRDFDDAGWASCERRRVTDRTSNAPRRIRATPVERDLDLRIMLRETDAGTEVRLDPEFSEEQINPFTNLSFTAPCRSTGELEAELLGSI
jgi:hypothetical protein